MTQGRWFVPLLVAISLFFSPTVMTLQAAEGHHTNNDTEQSIDRTNQSDNIASDPDQNQSNKKGLVDQTDPTTHHDDEHDHSDRKSGLFERFLPGFTQAPDLHPMFVHFPIVLLWTSLLFVIGSWFFYPVRFLQFGRWLFWLSLVALPITAATGFWAVGGWGGGHLTSHRNLMLITITLSYVLFGLLRVVSEVNIYRFTLTIGLIILVLFMSLGADRGAWLVFVEGSGVKPVEHNHNH